LFFYKETLGPPISSHCY